jgi:hypothetical protein
MDSVVFKEMLDIFAAEGSYDNLSQMIEKYHDELFTHIDVTLKKYPLLGELYSINTTEQRAKLKEYVEMVDFYYQQN